jgi:hypothetical protein
MEYSEQIAAAGLSEITEGVIIPSPYEKVCEYCKYGALCGMSEKERTVGSVSETTISQAIKGGEENVD